MTLSDLVIGAQVIIPASPAGRLSGLGLTEVWEA